MDNEERSTAKETRMMKAQGLVRSRLVTAGSAALLAMALLAGCDSQQDKAIDTAKKQAAATGQPQQVVSVDKAGNTTTTTVQPPAPGQTTQAVTTTVTPAAAGQPGGVPANGPMYANGQPAPGGAVAGGAPVIRPADVNIPAGSELTIRINQNISVKHTPAGAQFDGEVVEAWTDSTGRVILPKGTPVNGVVDESHRRGHFKGRSELELRLTSLTLNGTQYPVETRDLRETKKGKGKRSAGMIGGGAGLGMLIGGIASGGTGLLIGGLAGGGAGTASAGLTGNRDLDIPAESIVHFKLAGDLTLKAS